MRNKVGSIDKRGIDTRKVNKIKANLVQNMLVKFK